MSESIDPKRGLGTGLKNNNNNNSKTKPKCEKTCQDDAMCSEALKVAAGDSEATFTVWAEGASEEAAGGWAVWTRRESASGGLGEQHVQRPSGERESGAAASE